MIDMEVGEMEAIAVNAMDIHDIDEMYGHLWETIRKVKGANKSFFKECMSKSEPTFLLRCYVTWIRSGDKYMDVENSAL